MRDFFKYTLATFVGLVLFATVGLGGLAFLVIAVATSARDAGPRVDNKSVLTFDLSTEITDNAPAVSPGEVVTNALSNPSQENKRIALRTVLNALESAAADDKIVGLYLYGNISPGGAGLTTLGEIRQALEAFQAEKKPIIAYGTSWSERDYYLVSIADTIALNPTGFLEINGFASESTFFAGALQRFGIGIQAVRVGRYKSAIEPFTRSDRSPEEREQTRKLLTDLWGQFLTTTTASRDLTTQQMQAIADTRGVLSAKEATASTLIDQAAYSDELLPDLLKLTDEDADADTFRQISLPSYAAATQKSPRLGSGRNRIAIVYAEGDIVDGEGDDQSIGGDALARLLRKLRQDEDVKAIVLRVNSPGGSASASARVAREVQLTNAAKPVIVSMGSLAASGGYQISTHATKIFASPTTITGSIGVFGLLPNVQQLANNNGITWDVVKTARLADGETISRPKTPEELAIAQKIVDQIYDDFISSVAESRSLPKAKVAEIAQGRVWSGLEAKNLGLVDELGGLEAAIDEAVKAAKLGEERWQIDEYPALRTFEQQLVARLFGSELLPLSEASRDPLNVQLLRLREDLETLRSLNDPQGVYTRLPFNPWID